MEYVESVRSNAVVVHCESHALRRVLAASDVAEGPLTIAYGGRAELADVHAKLQSLGVPFVSAGPNPPSDVFDFLAAEGLVTGKVRRIFWRGPLEPAIIEP